MANKILSALRQEIGRWTSSMITGTPSGGYGINTFQCSTLADIYSDDFFNDWWLRFYAGTHKDTTKRVTDFADTNGVVTFKSDLATAVDVTDLFELHKDFTPEEINAAINAAITMVENEALQDKVDATLETAANTYEYDIPTGFLFIDQIFQESGTADRYSPTADLIDFKHWRILHGTTPKIWFDNDLVTLTTGRNLRVVGQTVQAQLSLDASTCAIKPSFIVYQAKALLHQSRIRSSGSDFEEHQSQMVMAQTLADKERKTIGVTPRGRKVTY